MKTIDLYRTTDYRAYIRDRVASTENRWGLWARLAEAAACQSTYLSQAMKEKVNLTSDQLLGIARYWDLSDSETEYLLLLLDYARAATKELRAFLLKRINRLRKEHDDIAKRLDKPKFEPGEKETLYYSTWFWSALHVIVSIPEFQSPKNIAARLSLPVAFVEQALERLAKFGIVERKGNVWRYGVGDIHVPKDSVLVGMHHNNWRQRAVMDSTSPLGTDGVHYTSVYSMSQSDFESLKEQMLAFIEASRKQVASSKEEELVCFTCDLFRI